MLIVLTVHTQKLLSISGHDQVAQVHLLCYLFIGLLALSLTLGHLLA